jgi:hypothetical protein
MTVIQSYLYAAKVGVDDNSTIGGLSLPCEELRSHRTAVKQTDRPTHYAVSLPDVDNVVVERTRCSFEGLHC